MRAVIRRRAAAVVAATCMGVVFAAMPAVPALTGAAATAQQAANATGTWRVEVSLGGTVNNTQYWRLTDTAGTITGDSATTPAGTAYGTMNGTRAGNAVTLANPYTGGGYTATMTGTIGAAGTTMNGTWSDTNGQSGTFAATLTTPPAGGGGGTTPPATGTRASAVAVFCNRGPNPGDSAVCTATVGDAGPPPRTTPTGSVRFTATAGALTGGDTCTLAATPSSPGVASCAVTYQPPPGFGAGVAFPVTAEYLGDANLAAGGGAHRIVWPGCIGTAATPCGGGVSLAFASTRPKLAGMRLPAAVGCGAGTARAQQAAPAVPADPCTVTVTVGTTARDTLRALGARGLTTGEMIAFGERLEATDPVMAQELIHLIQGSGGDRAPEPATLRARRVHRMAGRRIALDLGETARVALTMERRGRILVTGLRRAGVTRITVTVRMVIAASGGRKGRTVTRAIVVRL